MSDPINLTATSTYDLAIIVEAKPNYRYTVKGVSVEWKESGASEVHSFSIRAFRLRYALLPSAQQSTNPPFHVMFGTYPARQASQLAVE